jgi:hypothetical protein
VTTSAVLMASLHGDEVDVVWVTACSMWGDNGFEIVEIAAEFQKPRRQMSSAVRRTGRGGENGSLSMPDVKAALSVAARLKLQLWLGVFASIG